MSVTLDKALEAALAAAMNAGLLLAPNDQASQKALKRRMHGERVISPHPGLFASRNDWLALTPREQHVRVVRTLAAQHPNWVFCSFSAAAVHGLEVPDFKLQTIHIVGGETICKQEVLRHHIAHPQMTVVGGIPVTSLERTLLDCMRDARFGNSLAIADSALRVAGISKEELDRRMQRSCRGIPGVRRTRGVIGFADPRSENGGESYARAVMIEHGVMLPELQVPFHDDVSGKTYRIDFGWGLVGRYVAGELDGKGKYEDLAKAEGKDIGDVMREERQRESRIRNRGIVFARFTFEQVREVLPLLAILERCGVPITGSPPPSFDELIAW